MSAQTQNMRPGLPWITIALALVGLTVIPALALTHYMSTEERIEELRQRVDGHRAIVASKEAWQRRLRELEDSEPVQQYLLSESRPSLAEAELQQRVQEAINGADGRVVTMSGLPRRQDIQFGHVAVQVRMQGDIRTLKRTLYTLEYGEPFLRIDRLQVRTGYSPAQGESNDPVTLDVLFEVVGFLVERSESDS